MPFSALPAIPFPALPNLPGVPAIGRLLGANLPLPFSIIADALGLGALFPPAWGIFSAAGQPVLIGDAVLSVEMQQDYRVADFPIERGAFASYNKVISPIALRVGFMVGGSDVLRQAFLAAVDAACASLATYQVITPDVIYANLNLTHYDYRREARAGAKLLHVDVWAQEVRVAASSTFTSTADPASADPLNGGTRQTYAPNANGVGIHGAIGSP